MNALARFRQWRARRAELRRWPLEIQIEHARNMIMMDERWMAHDPVVSALTARYIAALSPQWYQREFAETSRLRENLGLDPYRRVPKEQPPAAPMPADPMDWPLPCDVVVGHGTMRKGVKLRALVLRMKALYEMATGENADEVASRTPEERAERFQAFISRMQAEKSTQDEQATKDDDDQSNPEAVRTR